MWHRSVSAIPKVLGFATDGALVAVMVVGKAADIEASSR